MEETPGKKLFGLLNSLSNEYGVSPNRPNTTHQKQINEPIVDPVTEDDLRAPWYGTIHMKDLYRGYQKDKQRMQGVSGYKQSPLYNNGPYVSDRRVQGNVNSGPGILRVKDTTFGNDYSRTPRIVTDGLFGQSIKSSDYDYHMSYMKDNYDRMADSYYFYDADVYGTTHGNNIVHPTNSTLRFVDTNTRRDTQTGQPVPFEEETGMLARILRLLEGF